MNSSTKFIPRDGKKTIKYNYDSTDLFIQLRINPHRYFYPLLEWQYRDYYDEDYGYTIDQFEKLSFLKEGKGDTWAQIALRFILSNDAVSTVIPGAKTPQQVEDNCAASDLGLLPESDLEKIGQLYDLGFA